MTVTSVLAILGVAMALVFMLTMGLAVGLAVAVNLVRRVERVAAAGRAEPSPQRHGHRATAGSVPVPPSFPPAPVPATDRTGGMVRPRDPSPWAAEGVLTYA